MKPDAYMPFFGDDFFTAVEMFGDSVALKYLRCVWFYWSHTHCDGLINDDEQLRNLCRCALPSWVRTKGMIFDNDKFFRLENGRWHQKKARELYQSATDIYNDKLTASRLGVEARRRLGQLPSVEPSVEPDVNLTKTITTDRENSVELPTGFPKTESESKAAAQFVGCPESFAIETWNKAMGRCGRDAKDIPIRSWAHYLKAEHNFQKNRQEKEKSNANSHTNRPDRNAGTYNATTTTDGIKSKIR